MIYDYGRIFYPNIFWWLILKHNMEFFATQYVYIFTYGTFLTHLLQNRMMISSNLMLGPGSSQLYFF